MRGGAIPPPILAQGKASSSSHGGKKRSGLNVPRLRRGINPKKRWGEMEKKRRNTSSSPPYGDLISRNSSSNTLGTYESPQFFPENFGPEAFFNDVTDRWSIRLVVMIHKIHRFLFSFANIDFAEIVSRL